MSDIIFPNNVEVVHTWRHGSKEWLIERAFTVGASEIGKALGVSPYGGLLSLVIDKRKARMGSPDLVSTEAMQDGQDAEATVLRMAWRRLQAIEGGVCEATATPDMVPGYPVALGVVSATPDAVIIDAETQRAVALIEAKLDRSRGTDWTDVLENGFGHLSGTDLRLNYWWQVQCQLYVTGVSVGYLAVWTVFDFYLIEIEADAAAAEVIASVGTTVMAWVTDPADRLPAPTDADGLRTIAGTVKPASEGPIEVGGEVAEALAAYVSLGKRIDALEEERDAAKRVILEAHNQGAKLATVDGIKSSFIAASERVSLDTKKLESEHPELVSQYRKVSQVSASCRVTAPRSKG